MFIFTASLPTVCLAKEKSLMILGTGVEIFRRLSSRLQHTIALSGFPIFAMHQGELANQLVVAQVLQLAGPITSLGVNESIVPDTGGTINPATHYNISKLPIWCPRWIRLPALRAAVEMHDACFAE